MALLLAVQTALASRVRLLGIDDVGPLTSFPQVQTVDDAKAAAAAASQTLQDILAKYADPQLLTSQFQASRLGSTSTTTDLSPQSKAQPSSSPTSSTPKQPTSAPKQPEGASTPEPGPKIANTPQQKPKTTSIPKQEPASTGSNSLKDKVLSVHNNLRARHQASPLSWSSSLAAGAQSWASGCEWGHAGVEEGENLAIGYPSVEAAMQVWADEEKRYQYGEVTPNMAHFEEIGHFTQMVWKSTTDIGCATAQCTWKGRDATYLVCRYSPAGNVLGQFAENVKPPE